MPTRNWKGFPHRGGPRSQHEELIVGGPFRGFESDLDPYHRNDPRVADSCQNVDFLEGTMRTRPGLASVMQRSALTTPPAGHDGQWYPSSTPILGGIRTDDTNSSVDVVWDAETVYLFETGALTLNDNDNTDYKQFSSYSSDATSDQATVTGAPPRTVTLSGGAIDFSADRFIEAWFKFDADPDSHWTAIASVAGGSPSFVCTLVADYPGGVTTPAQDFTIVIPVVSQAVRGSRPGGPVGPGAKYPDGANGRVLIPGSYGSVQVESGGSVVLGRVQGTTDLPWYAAKTAAVYNNRLFLISDISIETLNQTALATQHKGRIVYSGSGTYTVFNTLTSGIFDLEFADAEYFVIIRDVLYVVGRASITAVHKTGNFFQPFRATQVISGRSFVLGRRPVPVNGEYAYVFLEDGVYRFDGAGLQKATRGVREFYVGSYSSDASFGGQNGVNTEYDSVRDRVVVRAQSPGGVGSSGLLLSGDEGVTEYRISTDGEITYLTQALTVSGGLQEGELGVGVLEDDPTPDDLWMLHFQRSLYADAFPAANERIDWFWFSKELDMGSDEDEKTIDRVRIVFEVVSNANTGNGNLDVVVQVFSDGGTSPQSTSTFDLTDTATGRTAGTTWSLDDAFPPFTGRKFRIRIFNVATASGVGKAIIKQVSLRYIRRQEGTRN